MSSKEEIYRWLNYKRPKGEPRRDFSWEDRPSKYISKDDARRCLGVTRSTFERWCGSGRYSFQ